MQNNSYVNQIYCISCKEICILYSEKNPTIHYCPFCKSNDIQIQILKNDYFKAGMVVLVTIKDSRHYMCKGTVLSLNNEAVNVKFHDTTSEWFKYNELSIC